MRPRGVIGGGSPPPSPTPPAPRPGLVLSIGPTGGGRGRFPVSDGCPQCVPSPHRHASAAPPRELCHVPDAGAHAPPAPQQAAAAAAARAPGRVDLQQQCRREYKSRRWQGVASHPAAVVVVAWTRPPPSAAATLPPPPGVPPVSTCRTALRGGGTGGRLKERRLSWYGWGTGAARSQPFCPRRCEAARTATRLPCGAASQRRLCLLITATDAGSSGAPASAAMSGAAAAAAAAAPATSGKVWDLGVVEYTSCTAALKRLVVPPKAALPPEHTRPSGCECSGGASPSAARPAAATAAGRLQSTEWRWLRQRSTQWRWLRRRSGGGTVIDRQRRRRLVHTRGVWWAAPATVGRRAYGNRRETGQSMYSDVINSSRGAHTCIVREDPSVGANSHPSRHGGRRLVELPRWQR